MNFKKKYKWILPFALVIGLGCGLTNTDTPPTAAEPVIDVVAGASVLVSGEEEFNLGTFYEGDDDVSSSFIIQNNGNAELKIDGISFTDNTYYSLDGVVGFPLYISDETFQLFTINFIPAAAGTFPVEISISSDDEDKTPFILNYTALVEPALPDLQFVIDSGVYVHDSDAFEFSQLHPAETETETVRLKNEGSTEITINSLSLTDTDNYSISGLAATPFDIDAGSYIEFDLTFEPDAVGTYSTQILINNSSAINDYELNLFGACVDVSFTLDLAVDGQNTNFVYVAWLEDTAQTTIQHLWVCDRAGLPNTKGLQNTGLPVWSRNVTGNMGAWYEHQTDIDAVTSTTVRDDFTIQAEIADPSVRQFRVMFEIDRSGNGNYYFTDRPCFLYQSELIDLDDIRSSYSFTLIGWMINDTISGTYGQHPRDEDVGGVNIQDEFLAHFGLDELDDCIFFYSDELEYIEDDDGNYDDLINTMSVTITPF